MVISTSAEHVGVVISTFVLYVLVSKQYFLETSNLSLFFPLFSIS